MLRFLFPTLTAQPSRGEALFAAVTSEARRPHWFAQGLVPDTIDGRFRVLATVAALVLVRLERSGAAGDAAAVAFTERFVEVMESEHREIGLGDPTLGRTVRKLVGALSRRVDLWRAAATQGAAEWTEAARQSLHSGEAEQSALAHSAEALRDLWSALEAAPDAAIIEGNLG